jgi:hypothetical protein
LGESGVVKPLLSFREDIGADEYYHPALQVTKQAASDPSVAGEN